MMNDDEMDINDLFDDGTIQLDSRPPPQELFQRIDELRGSGSQQAIAWSKTGCIASISENGLDLEFRNLRCHPRDGMWGLSEPTIISHTQLSPPSMDLIPFQHLCWSPNGCDLAAIDVAGRISILTITMVLNRPAVVRSGSVDTPDELRAIVGAYWLNLTLPQSQARMSMTSLAVKGNKGYEFGVAPKTSYGPSHPIQSKSALLCLTTNGDLRLIWPQGDNKWYETSREMESLLSSTELITHASFCAEKNQTLLVAYTTTTKHLHAVRLIVKWNNKPPEKNAQPITNTPIIVNPDFVIAHLAATNWMDGTPVDGPDSLNIQSSMTALSHLEIIPPTGETLAGPASHPTILAVRSSLPASDAQFNQDVYSTIDRWELRDFAQSVHPAFQQLGSRKNTVSQLNSANTFKKLEGFTVNKVVIFVQAACLDRILCFGYSDGSFEYRDRTSLAQTFTEGGIERFTHISQAGFSFEDEEPCLQIALSPTTCSFVQIGCDGKYKWKLLRHHLDQLEESVDDAQYGALVAGLTMACSAALMTSNSYDDVLGMARRYTTQPTLSYDMIIGIARIMKFHFDYSDESHHDNLIRNPSIQLCLGIQNSLGYIGEGRPRKFASKLAWISLQIRNSVVLMTMATSMKVPDQNFPQKGRVSGLEDKEIVKIITGSVRWCLDLISWFVDSLLHPIDPSIFKGLATGQPINLENLVSDLQATNNVALHILLASATRGFLTAICRRLNSIDFIARKAISTVAESQASQSVPPLTSSALRMGYTTVATLTTNAVVAMRDFEAFLNDLSASIKDAYTIASVPSSTPQQTSQQSLPQARTEIYRNVPEQAILFGGALPTALVPAMRHIFTTLLPKLRSSIDPAKLFFHDFSMLGLDPFPTSSPLGNPIRATTPPLDDHLANNSLTSTRENSDVALRLRRGDPPYYAYAIDIFQRVPVQLGREPVPPPYPAQAPPETRQWRRCVRCAAVMEEVITTKHTLGFLIMQQRRCFCSGGWDILTGRQIVA